ncbi:MAG: hypothetical protein AB1297_03150 [bacterium]
MSRFEIKEDDKFSFVILRIPSFHNWLKKKGLLKELQIQPIRKKKEIFLMWKWGYSDTGVLEASEKQSYYYLLTQPQKDISGIKDEYNRNKIGWFNYTTALWELIEKNLSLTEEIENNLWENRFKEVKNAD